MRNITSYTYITSYINIRLARNYSILSICLCWTLSGFDRFLLSWFHFCFYSFSDLFGIITPGLHWLTPLLLLAFQRCSVGEWRRHPTFSNPGVYYRLWLEQACPEISVNFLAVFKDGITWVWPCANLLILSLPWFSAACHHHWGGD